MKRVFRLRVVIESPYGTRAEDGERCSSAEVARNERYLDRCIRDSIERNEAPYASHGFFTKPGRLDDTNPEQRRKGIEAGQAWGLVAHLVAVYADHGVSAGMAESIAKYTDEYGLNVEHRFIGVEPE